MKMPLKRPPTILSKSHLLHQCQSLNATEVPRIPYLRIPQRCRHASNTAPTSQPIRLEKPTKFVPPSHGQRLKQHMPRHYGPDLSQTQKVEQETKRYPNMFPKPGTFMFWFLTSSRFHSSFALVCSHEHPMVPFRPQ